MAGRVWRGNVEGHGNHLCHFVSKFLDVILELFIYLYFGS